MAAQLQYNLWDRATSAHYNRDVHGDTMPPRAASTEAAPMSVADISVFFFFLPSPSAPVGFLHYLKHSVVFICRVGDVAS